MVWSKITGKLEGRWVYGTRSKRWYIVDQYDRDFKSGLTLEYYNNHTFSECLREYLKPTFI